MELNATEYKTNHDVGPLRYVGHDDILVTI